MKIFALTVAAVVAVVAIAWSYVDSKALIVVDSVQAAPFSIALQGGQIINFSGGPGNYIRLISIEMDTGLSLRCSDSELSKESERGYLTGGAPQIVFAKVDDCRFVDFRSYAIPYSFISYVRSMFK